MLSINILEGFSITIKDVIRNINNVYNSFEYFQFDIISNHKSLLENDYNFKYSGKVFGKRASDINFSSDLIYFNESSIAEYSFLDGIYFKVDVLHNKVIRKKIKPPYKELRRGEFKWSTNAMFNLYHIPIDTIYWNLDSIHYTLIENDDDYVIEMCKDIASEVKFHKDDFNFGTKHIVIKVNKKSLLIHYVKEELDITKLPEISEYFISNFREIDSIAFSKYKLNSLEYYNGKAMLDKSEKSKPIANEVVLIKELNQDFLFYDLNDNIHILNDFNERYFVIEFWFCGCLACIKSSNVIAEIESEYNGRIKFIELNYMNNDKEQIKNYLANRKNKNNVYYLKNNILDDFISIYSAPTIIIYDKEKEKILYKSIGYSPNFKNDLVYELNNLILE